MSDELLDAMELAHEGGMQALEALVEAVWLYEFPYEVLFRQRAALVELLQKSLELDIALLGTEHATQIMRRKDRILEVVTGQSLLSTKRVGDC
jgi:hypothetical protein